MIARIAGHIVSELNDYFSLLSPVSTEHVAADSLFDLEGGANSKIKNKLTFSLVNIEQDRTYHSLNIQKKDGEGKNQIIKPEVMVNVYFLMISNFSDYEESLKAISRVIAFFQHRNSFDIPKEASPSSTATSHVIFEMVSMSFEQQNHLWGMLGGKYMPSVMYKAGIVDIQDERVEAIAPPVEEIRINE